MNAVRFLIRPRADLRGVTEIVPAIDDIELTELIHAFELRAGMETRPVSYGGLIPSYFNFGPMEVHFLGATSPEAEKTPLLGCSCGEWGCWPMLARIVATESSVMWSAFEQPHRWKRDYSALGPFMFAPEQYESALAELGSVLGEQRSDTSS